MRKWKIDTLARTNQAFERLIEAKGWASLSEIKRDAPLTFPTARAWLKEMQDAGWVAVIPDGNGYRISKTEKWGQA